jgi:hypothetical protein
MRQDGSLAETVWHCYQEATDLGSCVRCSCLAPTDGLTKHCARGHVALPLSRLRGVAPPIRSASSPSGLARANGALAESRRTKLPNILKSVCGVAELRAVTRSGDEARVGSGSLRCSRSEVGATDLVMPTASPDRGGSRAVQRMSPPRRGYGSRPRRSDEYREIRQLIRPLPSLLPRR